MGKKLTAIYDEIKKGGGLNAQMRLAMLTGISGPKAASEPDSTEMMAKFSNAYKEIMKENCPIR